MLSHEAIAWRKRPRVFGQSSRNGAHPGIL